MYLVLFFDQHNYEFNPSLHASRTEVEAAYKDLLRRFDCQPCIGGLADDCGEGPHLYRIKCDGIVGEEIHLDDLAAA